MEAMICDPGSGAGDQSWAEGAAVGSGGPSTGESEPSPLGDAPLGGQRETELPREGEQPASSGSQASWLARNLWLENNGAKVALLCESPSGGWYCPVCSRCYHSYSSVTQHMRRSHGVGNFAVSCAQCRELFSNRRSYNTHMGSCPGDSAEGTYPCSFCGERFRLPGSLPVHETYCPVLASGEDRPQTATDSSHDCRYCGESWPSQASLSQHIRGRHMAESQQDRLEETSEGREPQSRQLWTEELRLAFLEAADRLGWSEHSGIADHHHLTVRQVRNFKLKFPKDRWREKGAESTTSNLACQADVGNRESCGAEVPSAQTEVVLPSTGFSGVSSTSPTSGWSALTGEAEAAAAAPIECLESTGNAETNIRVSNESRSSAERTDGDGGTQLADDMELCCQLTPRSPMPQADGESRAESTALETTVEATEKGATSYAVAGFSGESPSSSPDGQSVPGQQSPSSQSTGDSNALPTDDPGRSCCDGGGSPPGTTQRSKNTEPTGDAGAGSNTGVSSSPPSDRGDLFQVMQAQVARLVAR